MKVGTKVFITENARVLLGLPDGIEFTIKDVLTNGEPYNVALSSDTLGKDWVEFFREEELIKL